MKKLIFAILGLCFLLSFHTYSQSVYLRNTKPFNEEEREDAGRNVLFLEFNTEVQLGTGNLTLYNRNTNQVVEQISYISERIKIDFRSVEIELKDPLGIGKQFYVLADEGFIKDLDDHLWDGISDPSTWTFETESYDNEAPRVIGTIPYYGDARVYHNQVDSIVLFMNEFIYPGTGNVYLVDHNTGSNVAWDIGDADLKIDGMEITIYNVSLQPNTLYSIEIDKGTVKDFFGNRFSGTEGANELYFKTYPDGIFPDPALAFTYPADDSQEVTFSLYMLKLIFNAHVYPASGTIRIYNDSDELLWTIDVSNLNKNTSTIHQVIFWNYGIELSPNSEYYILLDDGAFKDDNNSLPVPGISDKTVWNFSTRDYPRPVIAGFKPTDDGTDIKVTTNRLEINFETESNAYLQRGTGNIYLHKTADNTLVRSFPVQQYSGDGYYIEVNSNQLVINFYDIPVLEPSTGYYILADEGFVKYQDNYVASAIDDPSTWNFTTEDPEYDSPVLVSTEPADDATGILIHTDLVLEFDEQVFIKNDNAKISLYLTENDELVSAIRVDEYGGQPKGGSEGSVFSYELPASLEPATHYYVKIDADAFEDVFENTFPGITDATSWNFTTQEPDLNPPLATAYYPGWGASGVPVDAGQIEITFDEPIGLGSRGGIWLYKVSNDELVAGSSVDGPDLIKADEAEQVEFNFRTMLLEPSTEYYVLVGQGVAVDAFENEYEGISDKGSWTFTTEDGDDEPPVMAGTYLYPYPGDTDIGVIDAYASLSGFDESVVWNTGSIYLYKYDNDELVFTLNVEDIEMNYISNSLDFYFPVQLEQLTTYYIQMDPGVITDIYGNAWEIGSLGEQAKDWYFTTEQGDMDPPDFTNLNPYNGRTGVELRVRLEVGFDEPVYMGAGKLTIYKKSDDEKFIELDVHSGALEFNYQRIMVDVYDRFFELNTEYYVTIDPGFVKDYYGNEFAGFTTDSDWSFTTIEEDVEPPAVVDLLPEDDGTNVSLVTPLALSFDELVKPGTGNMYVYRSSNDELVDTYPMDAPGVVVMEELIGVLLNQPLELNTEYYVLLDNGAVTDILGNGFAGIDDKTVWNFTTETTADTTPPEFVDTSPYQDESMVELNRMYFEIEFDEYIAKGNGSIYIYDENNELIREISMDDPKLIAGTEYVNIPVTNILDYNTTYYILIDEGAITDAYGNPFAGIQDKYTWRFTTVDFTGPKSVIAFTSSSETVSESAGTVLVPIELSTSVGAQQVMIEVDNGTGLVYGVDYTTIPAVDNDQILVAVPGGTNTLNLEVIIDDDLLIEENEILTLTISEVGNALEIGSINSITLTIENDDVDIFANFEASALSVEETAGNQSITISTTSPVSTNQDVEITLSNGTGLEYETDYDMDPAAVEGKITLTIPAGSSSALIDLEIFDDLLDESDEVLTLTITAVGTELTIGNTSALALTITDDDVVSALDFASASQSIDESAGTVTISLTTANELAADQEVEININNGAGCFYTSDYTTDPSVQGNKITLTIPKGTAAIQFDVIIVDDDNDEGDEIITFTLGSIGTLLQAGVVNTLVMTIGDNDETVITGLEDLRYMRKIYPNPTSDILYVPQAEKGIFYDLTGKIVAVKQANNGFMDISRLPAGIYQLLLTGIADGETMSTKVIISR